MPRPMTIDAELKQWSLKPLPNGQGYRIQGVLFAVNNAYLHWIDGSDLAIDVIHLTDYEDYYLATTQGKLVFELKKEEEFKHD